MFDINHKHIFDGLDRLDVPFKFLNDEIELIKEDINKIIKKQSVNLIKQFLEDKEGKCNQAPVESIEEVNNE